MVIVDVLFHCRGVREYDEVANRAVWGYATDRLDGVTRSPFDAPVTSDTVTEGGTIYSISQYNQSDMFPRNFTPGTGEAGVRTDLTYTPAASEFPHAEVEIGDAPGWIAAFQAAAQAKADQAPVQGTVTLPEEWLAKAGAITYYAAYGGSISAPDRYVEYAWVWTITTEIPVLGEPVGGAIQGVVRQSGNVIKLATNTFFWDQLAAPATDNFPGNVKMLVEVDWLTNFSVIAGSPVPKESFLNNTGTISIWHEETITALSNPILKWRVKYSNGFIGGWRHMVLNAFNTVRVTPIADLAVLVEAESGNPTGSFTSYRWRCPVVRVLNADGSAAELTTVERDPVTGDGVFTTTAPKVVVDLSGMSQAVPANFPLDIQGRINKELSPELIGLEFPYDFYEFHPTDYYPNPVVCTAKFDYIGAVGSLVTPWLARLATEPPPDTNGWDGNIPGDWIPHSTCYAIREGQSTVYALARMNPGWDWQLFQRTNYNNETNESGDWEEVGVVWSDEYYGAMLTISNGVMVSIAFKRETRELHVKRSFDSGGHWEELDPITNGASPRPLALTNTQNAHGSTVVAGYGLTIQNNQFRLHTSNDYGENWS